MLHTSHLASGSFQQSIVAFNKYWVITLTTGRTIRATYIKSQAHAWFLSLCIRSEHQHKIKPNNSDELKPLIL